MWSVIDSTGNQKIVTSELETKSGFSCGLIQIAKQGLYGFADTNADIIADPIYNEVFAFENNVSFAKKDKQWYILKRSCKLETVADQIPPEEHTFTDGICTECKKTPAEILKEDLPAVQWSVRTEGQYKYYTVNADSLAAATEILKQLPSIPQFTYYTVFTPDGKLGRDIVDFYTEAPLKTKGLQVKNRSSGNSSVSVDALSLTDFGEDIMKTHTTVAAIKSSGQYAKLILMMKCGHCGYESPVETEEGAFERECYFCGTTNKAHRAGVNVVTPEMFVKL
jgi:hypothetical protein